MENLITEKRFEEAKQIEERYIEDMKYIISKETDKIKQIYN